MITILLLSHNNPQHLKRALGYYKKLEFKGRILIADSSRPEHREITKKTVEEFTERLFAPVLLEYENTLTFPEKIAFALEEVATEYVLLAGVDDLFSVQFIYEALWFLKNNKDYFFVYGKVYGFTLKDDVMHCYYTGYYDKLRSFDDASPLVRLEKFLPRYSACFYAVFRTAQLKNIAQKSIRFTKTLIVYDNLFMLLALLTGKAKYIDKPFHWRELSDNSYGEVLSEKWLTSQTLEADMDGMEKTLETWLVENNVVCEGEADLRSKAIIRHFFEFRYELKFKNESRPKRILSTSFPAFFIKKSLQLKHTVKNVFINAGQYYLYNPKNPYGYEFLLIKQSVKLSAIESIRTGLMNVKQL